MSLENILKVLKELGLKDKEIKVYLAVLKLGPAPVRRVAEEASLNRGTTYDVLKSLLAQNLVAYFHKRSHKYFVAEDPERIIDILETRKTKLEKIEKEIKSVLPQLKSIYDNAGDKPVVKFYEGFKGLKFILKDVLLSLEEKKKKNYFVYSAETMREYLHRAYPGFTQERIKKGIRVKVIALGQGGQLCGLDERKWISRIKSAPTYIIIYTDKIALISIDRFKNPLGVIVEDKGLVQTQKILFDFIWRKL